MTTDSSSVTAELAEEQTQERTIEEIAKIVQRQGYSLLTDAEIDRYLEWMSEVKAASHEAVERTRLAMAQGEQMRADAQAAYERAQANFQAACAAAPAFEVVTEEVSE